MKASALLALLSVACIAPSAGTTKAPPSAATSCPWPNDADAAVSLTYDDALESQLLFALPVLDQHGVKATFFLSGGHAPAFAKLRQGGHELASHTVHHPCNADLAELGLKEMADELDASQAAITALLPTAAPSASALSFAYPCGQTRLKDSQSYVPLVKERFTAARGVAGVVADPTRVDLYDVPALFPPSSSDGSDVIAFVERARQSHGWAVIGFHGISEAGEYLQMPQAAHDKLVAYLAAHAHEIWSAPFGAVASSVRACRGL